MSLAGYGLRDTDSCSTNCQLNALGVYVHRKRYGVSPYVFPLAHDVRVGLMSRDDALRAVNGSLNHGIVAAVAGRLGMAESVCPELLEPSPNTAIPGSDALSESAAASAAASIVPGRR